MALRGMAGAYGSLGIGAEPAGISPQALQKTPTGRQSGLFAMGLALLLSACANQQLQTKTQPSIPTTQVLTIDLQPEDLRKGGIAFITPSSITGQEEDKQALSQNQYDSAVLPNLG